MRIRFLLISMLIVSALGLALAHAQTVGPGAGSKPYKAAMPVADTSEAQRNHAFAVALGSILVRAAGDQVTEAPGFTDALGNAANLVQDYQYTRAPKGARQPFVLKMEFDSAAVHLLAQNLQKQIAAAQPAAAASAPPEVATVWVAPMASAMDLARLLSTVRNDPKVSEAEPVGADANGVMLRIESQSALPALVSSLQSGGHLAPAPVMHPGADASLHWVH